MNKKLLLVAYVVVVVSILGLSINFLHGSMSKRSNGTFQQQEMKPSVQVKQMGA